MVSIANAKGGVGKTTTAVNLAAGLARMGKRTLLIDMDYQANATCEFINPKQPNKYTIADVLLETMRIDEAIIPVRENLDIIPSSMVLTRADIELASQPGRDTALQVAMEDLDGDAYDYVVADLPPNAGVMVTNGMAASDGIIIPIQTHFYAMAGVNIISDLVDMVKRRLNRRLVTWGALATMFDKRNNICIDSLKELQRYFGDLAFETLIRTNVALAEAPGKNMDIFTYAPKSAGAEDYEALCAEFDGRVERRKTA